MSNDADDLNLPLVACALGRAWATISDWVGLDPFNHPFKWTNPEDAWEDDESWLPSVSSARIDSSVSWSVCEKHHPSRARKEAVRVHPRKTAPSRSRLGSLWYVLTHALTGARRA